MSYSRFQELDLADPAPGEVLVRLVGEGPQPLTDPNRLGIWLFMRVCALP
ncbi:MAG: hypothetical protein WA484_08000 [Solirubrobacteraceae bacterium]